MPERLEKRKGESGGGRQSLVAVESAETMDEVD